MRTLIVENFIEKLSKYMIGLQVTTYNFWIVNPEINIEDEKVKLSGSLRYNADIIINEKNEYVKKGEKATVNYVFWPWFDSETGVSHLIYSKRNLDDETMTVYHEEGFQQVAKQFIGKLKQSYLDRSAKRWDTRLKIEQNVYELKHNEMDPNYASLLNYMFAQLGGNKKEKALIDTIREDFVKNEGSKFLSNGQELSLDDPRQRTDDFSNVLGIQYLTSSVIMAFYQTIPNHSKIRLLGVDADSMFREGKQYAQGRTLLSELIGKENRKEMYFIMSNPGGNHWVLFVIQTKPALTFTIYDSIKQPESLLEKFYVHKKELVRQMDDVFKPQKEFTENNIIIAELKKEENQKDGYNCGIFTLLQMQKILNNTRTIFDVVTEEGKTNTLEVTPASYRMDILAKIWASGRWQKRIDKNLTPTLSKLFSNLYIAMYGQIDKMNRTEEQSIKLYQAMLDDENSQNEFKLKDLWRSFNAEFKQKTESIGNLQVELNKTDNKDRIKRITDSLTSVLSLLATQQLTDTLHAMQIKTNKTALEIIKKRNEKVSAKAMSTLLQVDLSKVNVLYSQELDRNNKPSYAGTLDWLAQFDAEQRKNIYQKLFGVEKKKEDQEKRKEETELSKKLNSLSVIVSAGKCETDYIIRIADRLLQYFANNVLNGARQQKIKSFSIKGFLNKASSSSSTMSAKVESALKGWNTIDSKALELSLESVISVLNVI